MHWLDKYYGRARVGIAAGGPKFTQPIANNPGPMGRVITEEILPVWYNVGYPKGQLVIVYALAQMMLESTWLSSNLALKDNNYSGIRFINKPYQNATKGIPRPKNEGGGNYAHFATFADWSKDFLRILSLNTGGQGRPIDATTAQQYGDRLKANHYFTDPNYGAKFNAALKKVNVALVMAQKDYADWKGKYDSGQRDFTVTAGKPGFTSNADFNIDRALTTGENWWTGLEWYKKGGIILAAILTVKAIQK